MLYMKILSSIEKEKLLSESKQFCILPWVHLEIQQDGSVFPCCRAQLYKPLGNVKDGSLLNSWNSPNQKELRLSMLKGVNSHYCTSCYQIEEKGGRSPRNKHNLFYQKEIERIDQTLDDGGVKEMSLKYIGIRFSNLCNLECVYCNPIYSSRWAQTQKYPKDKIITYPFGAKGGVNKLVKENIDSLDTIYIAGGESLLEEEHFEFLEYLIGQKRTDINLVYNTNLTKLTFGKKSILEKWKSFKNIILEASIDSEGERNDFIRTGSNWKKIEENIILIKKEAPEINFRLYITNTLLNVLYLPTFLKSSLQRGWVTPKEVELNNVNDPAFYAVSNLPQDLKEKCKDDLLEFIQEYLMARYSTEESVGLIIKIKGLINLLKEETNPTEWPKLRLELERLDSQKGLNFKATFPELRSFFDILVAEG